MSLCPFAIKKLIPPSSSDPAIDPCGGVFHVAVSNSDSLYDLFLNDGGIESHFYVRFDGTVEQYRDTNYEADAQYDGNSFWRDGRLRGLLSIETEGGVPDGGGTWTPAQIASLKRLVQWCHTEHGIAMQPITAWNGDGWGYHAEPAFHDQWNKTSHSCPGPERIKQVQTVLWPWMKQGGGNPWPAFRSTSPAVGAMVAKLAANGYFNSGHRDKPNYYGAWTRGAIERLQASFDDTKAAPDGIIGPLTWAHIQALPDQPPAPPARKFPILDPVRTSLGDTERALDAATKAHPKWQFGKDMRAALETYREQIVNIQKP